MIRYPIQQWGDPELISWGIDPETGEEIDHSGAIDITSNSGGSSGSSSSDSIPIGIILPYAGSTETIPAGYLICNGNEVSRSAFPDLFTAIGTTYGEGDTTTTFNLPNIGFIEGGEIPVYGNGKTLAHTDGTNLFAPKSTSTSAIGYNTSSYGQNVGDANSASAGTFTTKMAVGVATKTKLGNNLQNSGLVANIPSSNIHIKYIIKALNVGGIAPVTPGEGNIIWVG